MHSERQKRAKLAESSTDSELENEMPIGSKRMSKLYRGTNVATRPIPRDVWTDDLREQDRNAIQTRPREGAQTGRVPGVGAPQIAGRRVRPSTGGTSFSPAQSNKKFR